jgi:mono/diheme cytochrome c family protein
VKRVLIITLLALSVVLVAYWAIIGIDKYLTVGRMWETPGVKPHEEELLIMGKRLVPFEGGEAIFRATKGEELKSPLQPVDPMNMALGKRLYFTFCAQCHGKYYDGNGPVGQSFNPLPTDLRSPKVQSLPEGVMFKVISYGIPKPDNRQPPLATTIDVLDRWRIIAHVKSQGPRE